MDRVTAVDGLILRSVPFREKDRLLSVWTEERGRIRVVAQGALLVANRLVPLGQCGLLVRLWLARGRELDRVTDFRILWCPTRIRQDWKALAAFQTMVEVLEGGWLLEGAEPGLLPALVAWVRHLDDPSVDPALWLKEVLEELLRMAGLRDERDVTSDGDPLTGLEKVLSLWEQNLESPVRSRKVWVTGFERDQRKTGAIQRHN
ncbi:MAG: recombination protein O N-terminal domain-containing protein [Armatimonadetes bacterium]|nr:recombination protein O N-terminal domain-containing protein [Armatimonadota bacterium]MDW8122986.1 recombination protein O N-terminal domain-containing protein [Armatimonadota bacterium]